MNKKMCVFTLFIIIMIGVLILVCKNSIETLNYNQLTSTIEEFATQVQIISKTPTLAQETSLVLTPTMASLENLIRTNGHCNLPCFWGIEPGKTKWTDAMMLFEQLGVEGFIGTTPQNYKQFDAIVDLEEVSFHISLYMDTYRKDETVGAILVSLANKPPLTGFHPNSEIFSLQNTFSKFGAPTEILFSVDFPIEPSPSQTAGYSFWLIYDEVGIQMDFIGSVEDSETIKVCPEQTFEYIMMYLYSPSLMFLPWGFNITSDLDKLEDISSISATDFYNLTIQSIEPICIKIEP